MSKVKCLKCGKVLISKFRHDFQQCDCKNGTFVDGGNDYTRIGGKDLTLIKTLPDLKSQEKTFNMIEMEDWNNYVNDFFNLGESDSYSIADDMEISNGNLVNFYPDKMDARDIEIIEQLEEGNIDRFITCSIVNYFYENGILDKDKNYSIHCWW
jgi:hypothetical protein